MIACPPTTDSKWPSGDALGIDGVLLGNPSPSCPLRVNKRRENEIAASPFGLSGVPAGVDRRRDRGESEQSAATSKNEENVP